jgi:Ser/Thr protein kinase RdoA (MazF antagonist)
MADVPSTPPVPPVPPEITLAESARSTLADFGDLVRQLPGGDIAASAAAADRISEEVSELAAMLRSLPGRPVALAGHDWQMLAALRTSHQDGEDVAEAIAHALARLAAELGSSVMVTVNRPGSWEAAFVAGLLAGMVGPDDESLAMYGTTA